MNTAGGPEQLLDIDFLPQEYREQGTRKKVKTWRIAAAAGAVLMVVVALVLQFQTRYQLSRRLAEMKPLREAAQGMTNQLNQSQEQHKALAAHAELVTYLRHPWPRTQVLAAVLTPLPERVTLHRVALTYEQKQTTGGGGQPKKKSDNDQPPANPALADLEDLRLRFERHDFVVHLQGVTENIVQLHQYLEEVDNHTLIAKTEIVSIGRAKDKSASASSFHLRLIVIDGYSSRPGVFSEGEDEASVASVPAPDANVLASQQEGAGR